MPRTLSLKGPETDLEAAVASAEVVHMHGLWQSHTRRGPGGTPGTRPLPDGGPRHGRAVGAAAQEVEEVLYMALVESRNLPRAACLHALSRPEIGHLRELAPWTPICFVPNGVNLDSLSNLPPRSVLEQDHPELKDKFVLLFFGRVHVKKGLDLMAEALGCLAPDFPDLHVLIAGNDDGAWPPFADRVAELGLAQHVTSWATWRATAQKRSGERPTRLSCPATAKGSAWPSSRRWHARYPVSSNRMPLPRACRRRRCHCVQPEKDDVLRRGYVNCSKVARGAQRLGANGRRLVTSTYTWDQQAHKLASVYQWLSGGGPPPDCVMSVGSAVRTMCLAPKSPLHGPSELSETTMPGAQQALAQAGRDTSKRGMPDHVQNACQRDRARQE